MVNFAVLIIGLLVLDLTKAFSLVKTKTNPLGVVEEGGSLLLSCKGGKFSEAVFCCIYLQTVERNYSPTTKELTDSKRLWWGLFKKQNLRFWLVWAGLGGLQFMNCLCILYLF